MSDNGRKLYDCQWTQEGCAPAKVPARGCLIQQATKKPREGTSTWYPCAGCETGQQIMREQPELKKSIDAHLEEHGQHIARRRQGLSSFPFYPTNNEGFAGIAMTAEKADHPPDPPKPGQDPESPALISKYGPSILRELDAIIKQDGSATRRSLLDRLGISAGTLPYHLKNLEKAGFIIITPGRWATDGIKIDLSEKGRVYVLSQNGGKAAGPVDPTPPDLPNARMCEKHGLSLKISRNGKILWGCDQCFQEWSAMGNQAVRARKDKTFLLPDGAVILDLSPYPELRHWLETSQKESLRADLGIEVIYWLRKIMTQQTRRPKHA